CKLHFQDNIRPNVIMMAKWLMAWASSILSIVVANHVHLRNSAVCTPVSVVGDATYCINAPIVCGGVTGACPKRGDIASANCVPALKSYSNGPAGSKCVAPADAECKTISSGVQGYPMPLEMRPSDNNDGNDNAVIPVEISESVGSYTAKLMDDAAIQSLRRELRAYEASIAQDGHMKEFVATKPTKVSRIELRQLLPCRSNNDDDAVAIEHPTAPSTVDGTPVARPLRPHRNSVMIRRRDSFATAMVKHHLGFDPLMQTDDESSDKHRAEESTITPRRPASAITSHNHKTALPTKPASRSRPATVNVSSGAARQRPFAQVHKEEKVALQGKLSDLLARTPAESHNTYTRTFYTFSCVALEAQYSAAKDMVLRVSRHGKETFVLSRALPCAKKLVSLELLSLSHNALESLNHFQHLTNLVEVPPHPTMPSTSGLTASPG
ncbi:hypothetical protein DYB32_009115, partial [Aphanomyces invadans]